VTTREEKVTVSTTHVAAGEGKSVWIGDRELVTFKAEGKDTGGAFALLELVGLPGSGPPPHIHHSVDETYCLLEGELEVLDGERTFQAKAGSVFHIRMGTLHAWRNATTEPVRTLLFVTPAGFEGSSRRQGYRATTSPLRLLLPRRRTSREWQR
jgi:quercetin dioxygenase-like cupin family protein